MSKLAVIYARFSSDKQREESIEGQIRECTAFAAANDIKIVGTYIDRAMSARTADRPQFQAMIRDSSKQTFDYVIVYQLDRFARNRYDSATCKAKLKKNGVRVLSAKENIKDDPSGIILESVLEGMAEYYSAELAVKVKRGMTENVLEGKWPGGSVPLGYKLNAQKHLEIDPVGAECIRFIFKKYLEGWLRVTFQFEYHSSQSNLCRPICLERRPLPRRLYTSHHIRSRFRKGPGIHTPA